MSSKKRVIIIGAGPSGLSSAMGLVAKDIEVTIIESENEVGGLCRTVEYNNIKFDIGPHGFSPQIPEVVEKIKELLGDDFIEKENLHGIYFDNINYQYPPKLSDLLNLQSIKNGTICASSFFNAQFKKLLFKILSRKPENTFESKLISRFGKSFCEKLIFPLTLKAWGTKDLHPEFVEIRMTIPSFSKIIKKLFINSAKINNSKTFYYPVKGFGQTFDVIKDHLLKNNHIIELNSNIIEIKAETLNGPFKVIYKQNGETKELTGDILVSSIPNKSLIHYLEETNLVNELISKADNFVSRNLRLGILVVENFSLPYRVIFFPEEKFNFNRVTDMTHFADLGYPKNHAILMFDYIYHSDSQFEAMNDDDFNKYLIDSAMTLNWFKKENIKQAFNVKFPYVYPVINTLRYETQKEFDNFFRNTNIILCGREASSDYNNAHNAMAKGFLTSKYITEEISKEEYFKSAQELGRMPIGE